MWRTACFLNNQVIRNKEVMRLKMLYKITVANHGYCVLGGGGVFPVLLAAQLVLVMILKHPSKDVWF